ELPVRFRQGGLESAAANSQVGGGVGEAEHGLKDVGCLPHRAVLGANAVGFRHEAPEPHGRALIAAQTKALPGLKDLELYSVALDEEEADVGEGSVLADAAEEKEVGGVAGRGDVRLADIFDLIASVD